MSRISRLKAPLIIAGIFIVVAVGAAAVNLFILQPQSTDQHGYTAAKTALASAMKTNSDAQTAFTAELAKVKAVQSAMTTLPSAPKDLFPADTLSVFSTDMKTLDQASTTQAPGPATDLPTGKVSYTVATTALKRAAAGVRDDTTSIRSSTKQLQATLTSVTTDLRTAAAIAATQSQTVLVASQGASDSLQTAFATASSIDSNGTALTLANELTAYVTAGQQVIADNKAHPVKAKPVVTATPAPKPTPTVTPTPTPSPSATPKPTTTPSPSATPTAAPVDHTPHVVANGDYQATCTAATALFTQTTKSGNTITLSEATPYTYTTFSTDTGYGVKVSSCSTS